MPSEVKKLVKTIIKGKKIGRSGWQPIMARPVGFEGCIPGLEYLIELDQIFIKQKKEILEVIVGYETENRYTVLNSMGQQVYYIREFSSPCSRQCCGNLRALEMLVEDMSGPVMRFIRPLKQECLHPCMSPCDSCMDQVTVEAPPGSAIGRVQQVNGNCRPQYRVIDAGDNPVLLIEGLSYCACICPWNDVPFTVRSADGSSEVGRISKVWANLLQEFFTDADNFGISFPKDLCVKVKAVLLAASLLIDFMFFEENEPS